jgi:hypothetical protein
VGPEIEKGLSRIIQDVPRYQEELRAHYDSERVFNATASIFAHVVCYLVNVKALLASREWKRLLKSSFKNKLAQILSSLESGNKRLDRELRASQGARKSHHFQVSLPNHGEWAGLLTIEAGKFAISTSTKGPRREKSTLQNKIS